MGFRHKQNNVIRLSIRVFIKITLISFDAVYTLYQSNANKVSTHRYMCYSRNVFKRVRRNW